MLFSSEYNSKPPTPPQTVGKVEGLPSPVSHIASGWDHCGAVTLSGELYCWGSGANGKLGGSGDALKPRKVDFGIEVKYINSQRTLISLLLLT